MQFSKGLSSKCLGVLCFVAALVTGLSATAQQNNTDKSILSIERNKIDNTPTSIRFSNTTLWHEEQAQELFTKYLGTDGITNKMVLTSTTNTKQGITAKRYYQWYKGVKVEYGSFTLSCKNGTVAFITGNIYDFKNNPSAAPAIGERAAFAKALKKVGAQKYKWEVREEEAMIKSRYGKPDTSFMPTGKLAWIEDYQSGEGDRIAHLAWSFDIYAHEPMSRQKVFVDAVTGKILYSNPMTRHSAASGRSRYSGTVNFQSANTGSTYVLYDSTRGNGIHTLDMLGGTTYGAAVDISSISNTWPVATRDTVALDAHWAGAAVYDYWRTVQGRLSWDNLDGILLQYIHYGSGFNNAFWDGTAMTYGDGSGCGSGFTPMMSLDITAHEIGHGVCEATCNLIYESEPGAINEGFSDCWGATIENYANPFESDAVTKRIWQLGEEVDCGTPLRRMDFPKLRSQPDTWRGINWFSVIACTPPGFNDQCGVHTNSGVMNKWYYLITNGGSGTNDIGSVYSVTGLGFADAGNILYQTELILSSTSDYPALRTASINTAILLFGLCSPQEVAVTNAWYAVGIGAAYISPVTDIVGTPRMCVGASVTLTDPMPGGTWYSGNTAVATIGSVSGVVTGVSAGTSLITYIISTGCSAVKVATINPLPGTIGGSLNSCTGRANTLTNSLPGGTWTSSNTGVATIGSLTGVVNGISLGTATIDYRLPTGCSTTTDITVNQSPAAIAGPASACVGAVVTETNATPGGAWSSCNLAIADIDPSTGDLLGIAAGTTVITYLMPSGCMSTRNITVNITPAAIGGALNVCIGATTAISNPTPGGAWSSQFTGIATIGAGTGIATGVTAGITNISYTLLSGCYTTAVLNVNPTPGAITGAGSVCQGATTTLGNSVAGGTWLSTATTVATIDMGSGEVTGITPGVTTIVYQLSSGCLVSRTFTVNLTPAAISGGSLHCIGFNTTLTDATPGGAWTSGNTTIATVGSVSGIVTGVAPGSTAISYTLPTGCFAALPFTVTPLPTAITGPATVCEGSAATLSNTVPGGTWSSSIPGVATIGLSTGIATGVLAGTTNIRYTIAAGCFTTTNVTVLLAPAAITGSSLVCITTTGTLSNAIPGGTWTSSNPAIAPIDPSTGLVSGVALGTATITYSLSTGCIATTIITVSSASTAPIVGAVALCEGLTLPFTCASPGGTWSSSDPTVASITLLTGAITGNTVGTATITYTLATPCGIATATHNVVVNPTPVVDPITGTFTVCPGLTTTLANATPGGTWSSSNTALATVSGGLVTGIALGTPTISYTVTNAFACQESAYVPLSVSVPFTPAITPSGTVTICTGATAPLSATTGTGYTYQWKRAGINIPGATTAAYMTTAAGVYTIEERAPSGCVATSAPVTVVVNPAPVVTPSVFILASPDTMLCITASPVTFNAIPVNGGSSPALMWSVNGALVYTGLTYTYTPANGDIVKCKMVSSNICALPDTATDQRHMVITTMRTPAVSITAAPGTTVCAGGSVLLTANPSFGGSTPTYTWNKNGANIATGPSLSYAPAEGDRVYCTMNSNAACLTTNISTSPTTTLHTAPATANSLAITVSQSSIVSGQIDTFRAYCTRPGSSPVYQWYINGVPVAGATNSVYITSTLTHGQIVNCQVISSDPCTAPRTIFSTGITINVSPAGINTTGNLTELTLQPNPNNGQFRLYGKIGTTDDGTATLTVTNIVGQTVYTSKIKTTAGKVDEQIKLADNLANGLYTLTLRSGTEQGVYRFVIGK